MFQGWFFLSRSVFLSPTQQDGIIDFDYVGKAPFSARKS